jgi:hypothetical protein
MIRTSSSQYNTRRENKRKEPSREIEGRKGGGGI